ncbi:MAG: type II secretion system protein M, partial [Pseudomonadota bacterium]|nr:type II secretion system protein M [Pseudomonadota bacterium]
MIAQLQRWWLSRAAQERRVMAVGGIVLLLLLVVGLGILPLLKQHAGLARRLPALRQRAALLEAQA